MEFSKKYNRIDFIELAYKEHYNLLYNYGMKLIADHDTVEDMIQEIFIKLCKQKSDTNYRNIKTYLLKAMRNAAYDLFSNKKNIVSIDDIDFILPSDEDSLKAFFTNNEDKAEKYNRVLEMIKKLPPQQKHVLYLYYMKELSHKEISEILDINIQSSMNTMAKAIKKLRKLLTDIDYYNISIILAANVNILLLKFRI